MRSDMRRLVAGSAGILGSHLVNTFIAQGDAVTIVHNLSSGSLKNIDGSLTGGRATFVYLDVTQPLAEIRATIVKAACGNSIGKTLRFALPASPEAYGTSPVENALRQSGWYDGTIR
jgi:nucleoside-diphosphate-sugar epimerase